MDSIHIAILALIFLFFVLSCFGSKIEKYLSGPIFVIFMTCYSSARDVYWGDTNNYRLYYFDSDYNDFELGFEYLTSLFSSAGIGFAEYILFFSFVTSSIYAIAIFKWSKYFDKLSPNNVGILAMVFMMSIISFHTYYMSFEAMRDGLATGIVLLAMYYLVNDRRFIFVLLILISCLFHKVSLIFLPLIFVINLKLNVVRMLTLLFFTIILSIFTLSIIKLLPFVPKTLIQVIDYYANNTSNSKTVLIRYFLILTPLFYYTYNKLYQFRKVISLLFFCTLLFLMFLFLPDFSRRLLIKLEYISYPILFMIIFRNLNFKKRVSVFVMSSIFYVFFFSNYISFCNLLNISTLRGIFG